MDGSRPFIRGSMLAFWPMGRNFQPDHVNYQAFPAEGVPHLQAPKSVPVPEAMK